MPTEACQYFYECTACHMLLRPKTGDCRVFYSFGSVSCPAIQLSGKAASCSVPAQPNKAVQQTTR